ncbi:MAG: dual specificity protein phosphatase family protein [Nitrospiraceae bacterium]|nr:dual specificity protein phosphatase family protein [Nitrospiraceae bacterium]
MSLRVKFIAAVLLSLLILTAGYYLYTEEQGNFHPITPGEAYRSAQLDRDELEYYIKKYNIRSILNLRGENPDKSWYKEEMEISKEQNVKHYDIALAASRELTNEEVQKLMGIFKSSPRPILIHCQGGADRSGLAAAMWKVIVDKEPKSEAGKQLSILYGHLPMGKATAMDRFFENWIPSEVLN